MKSHPIYGLLKAFFMLFNADVVELSINGERVAGRIAWRGEKESQEFSWQAGVGAEKISRIVSLCEFLKRSNLVHNDRIVVSSPELEVMLEVEGWPRREAVDAIRQLTAVCIRMVDEGLETDSFFIHF